MNADLFFVPVLARALEDAEPQEALREALARIQSIGQGPQYRRGYQQFLLFMAAMRQGTGEGGFGADDGLRCMAERPEGVGVLVECEQQVVGSFHLDDAAPVRVIDRVNPGSYRVNLDTGRVLWEGRLEERDLLWSAAFPRRPFRVAADTGTSRKDVTWTIELLGGAITLRVLAGLEAGALEVTLKRQGRGR